MLALNNSTPFAAHYVLLPNEQGIDTLYVNVKATFDIGPEWILSQPQPAPVGEDIYWGAPGQSSLKYPSDVHPGKRGTDIAVLGSAWAAAGKAVRQLDVALAIGPCQKSLRVFGDRFWRQGRITPPVAFTEMPLCYENAFGGEVRVEDKLISLEQRNPVGKGYCGGRSAAAMEGQPLPNIEDPAALIQQLNDQPAPAGSGFIAPHWSPRADYAGTYDESWQRSRAPYLPLDYQPRFQNAAPEGLICKSPLTGGEEVVISNMHPSGVVQFLLPRVGLAGHVQAIRQPQQALHFVMETVIIDLNTMQLSFTWKACYPCSNLFPLIRTIALYLRR